MDGAGYIEEGGEWDDGRPEGAHCAGGKRGLKGVVALPSCRVLSSSIYNTATLFRWTDGQLQHAGSVPDRK